MKIQFNTDNNIQGTEALQSHVEQMIRKSMSRFEERITRIEVHLNDVNSHKGGSDDIKCTMESRLEGMQPIAVSNHAANTDEAVRGAIDKMKSALDSALGKLRTY